MIKKIKNEVFDEIYVKLKKKLKHKEIGCT